MEACSPCRFHTSGRSARRVNKAPGLAGPPAAWRFLPAPASQQRAVHNSSASAGGDAIGGLIAGSSRRVLAVQRALGDFGYGPVKPTGILGPDTRAAIEKFERDRRLPVTGQLSDRLVRELAATTGRPLE